MKKMQNYDEFKYNLNEGIISNIIKKIVGFFKKTFGKTAYAYIGMFLQKKNKIPKDNNGEPKVKIIVPKSWNFSESFSDAENKIGKVKEDVSTESDIELKLNESLKDERYNLMVITKDYFQVNEGSKYLREKHSVDDIIKIDSKTINNYTVKQLKAKILKYYKMSSAGYKLSLFIWGAPGIGKTAVTTQVANELDIMVQVWTLATIESTDLKGVPALQSFTPDPNMPTKLRDKMLKDLKSRDVNFTETISALPLILPTSNNNGTNDNGGILFFDEMNRAIPEVLNASLSLALDGKMDEYQLPTKWFVIAAGNRKSDINTEGIEDFEPAILNRFAHINFSPTFDEWKNYVKKKSFMDPDIIEFLESDKNYDEKNGIGRPKYYYLLSSNLEEVNEDPMMPSPRSWENASRVFYEFVNRISQDVDTLVTQISNWDGISSVPKEIVKPSYNWDDKYKISDEEFLLIFKTNVGEEVAVEFLKFHKSQANKAHKKEQEERRKRMKKNKIKNMDDFSNSDDLEPVDVFEKINLKNKK